MYLVLDVGGTNCRIAVFEKDNKRPKLIEYIKLSNNIEIDIENIEEVVMSYKQDIKIIVLGIAGVIDPKSYKLTNSPHIPSWEEKDLRDIFKKQFTDSELYVFNDTYLAALGEAYSNNYRRDFWYINWGSGIGGTLAKWENEKWKLYASEPGHMILDPLGPECNCSQKGCWDVLAGGKGISKKFNKMPKELLLSEWKLIVPIMSMGLMNIIAIAPVDLIVMGGGIALNQPQIIDLIDKRLSRDIKIVKAPIIKRTNLSDLAAIYGGFYFSNSIV